MKSNYVQMTEFVLVHQQYSCSKTHRMKIKHQAQIHLKIQLHLIQLIKNFKRHMRKKMNQMLQISQNHLQLLELQLNYKLLKIPKMNKNKKRLKLNTILKHFKKRQKKRKKELKKRSNKLQRLKNRLKRDKLNQRNLQKKKLEK